LAQEGLRGDPACDSAVSPESGAGSAAMRWTFLAATAPALLTRPSLLNQHGRERAVTPATPPAAATEPVVAAAAAEPVLADEDAAATVQHLKPPAAGEAAEPAAPSLTEELVGVEKDMNGAMDNLVDEILAPSVVDDAVAAKVQEIEDDYKQGPDGKKKADMAVVQTALSAAAVYLLGVVVSLAVYWVAATAYFLVAGFVWAFLCMNRPRAAKATATKSDFAGEFAPVGLFACWAAPITAKLEACCCAHFLWAETVAKLGIVELAPALFLVFFLVCVLPLPYFFGFVLLGLPVRAAVRTHLRRNYKQTGTNRCADCCTDFLAHAFCCCCAVHQEAAFVDLHQQAFAV